jgi:hypothetical protein
MSAFGQVKAIIASTVCPFGNGHHDLRNRELSNAEKLWLGSRVSFKISSVKNLVKRFKLSGNTFRNYSRAFDSGSTLHCKGGRPTVLDVISTQKMKDLAKGRIKPDNPTYVKTFNQEAEETAIRRGKNITDLKTPNKSTLFRSQKSLGTAKGIAEETSSARVTACASICNAVSFLAMNFAMALLSISLLLICNLDATQFAVGNDSQGRVKVWYSNEEGRPETLKACSKDKGLVSYFIKYFLLMFADGSTGPPVFVVADSNMHKEALDIHEVPGLGVSTDMRSMGYVVFCKTRCCNKKFFRWINEKIIFKEIEDRKKVYQLADDALTWFQLDGEPIQIEVYKEEDMLEQLGIRGIVIGKPPGSSTEITQPCDMGPCFLASKTTIKSINEDDVMTKSWMVARLEEVYKSHEAECHSVMPAHHKKLFTHGLVRVQLALQQSLRPRMIQDSFKMVGVHPFDERVILKNCKTPISQEQESIIMENLPHFAKKIMTDGELFDEDFLKAGIGNATEALKDALVVYRRRSCFLTSKSLIARERKKLQDSEDKKVEAERKRVIAAEKKRVKEDKKRSLDTPLVLRLVIPRRDDAVAAPAAPGVVVAPLAADSDNDVLASEDERMRMMRHWSRN